MSGRDMQPLSERPGYNASPTDWDRYANHLEAELRRVLNDEDSAGAECGRLEADMYELHAGLEDAGLPGAINADSIEERIARLLDVLNAARELREFCGGKPGRWTIEGKVLKEDGAALAMLSLVDFVNTVRGPDA